MDGNMGRTMVVFKPLIIFALQTVLLICFILLCMLLNSTIYLFIEQIIVIALITTMVIKSSIFDLKDLFIAWIISIVSTAAMVIFFNYSSLVVAFALILQLLFYSFSDLVIAIIIIRIKKRKNNHNT